MMAMKVPDEKMAGVVSVVNEYIERNSQLSP